MRKKRPKELSGGEKQRVSIARAFLSDAPLLLMDEPFSSLDTALKIRLAGVFAQLWKEKCPTVVFVTHDVEEACMLGHRILVLKNGDVACEINTAKEGMSQALPRGYGEEKALKEKLLQVLLGGN
jgi:ABC-type nitrate/sulfonate/bicarbonate transport system ATPase subunit